MLINSKKILALILTAAMTLSSDYSAIADSNVEEIITEEAVFEEIVEEEIAEEETAEEEITVPNESADTDDVSINEEEIVCLGDLASSDLTAADKIARNDDMFGQYHDGTVYHGEKKGQKLRQYLAAKYSDLDTNEDGELSKEEMEANKDAQGNVTHTTIEIKASEFPDISKNMVQFVELSHLRGVETVIIDGVDEIRDLFLPETTKSLSIMNTTLNMRDQSIFVGYGSEFDKPFSYYNFETFVLDNVIIGNRFETVDDDIEETNSAGHREDSMFYLTKYDFKLGNCSDLRRFIVNVSFSSSLSTISLNMGSENTFDQLTLENFSIKRNGSIGTIAVASSNPDSFFNKNYETVSDVAFEDAYFRTFLIEKMQADKNWDGFLTQAELDEITYLNINPNSVGTRYIDIIHNFNDLEHLSHLETLNIDLEKRPGAYIEKIKLPSSGNLNKLSIINSTTRYSTLDVPSVKELIYSNNTGSTVGSGTENPTIKITDAKGATESVVMSESYISELYIKNTSANEGKISLDFYKCNALSRVEFQGKGYRLKGDASFEECGNLCYLGREASAGVWQVDGDFDGNVAAFKVSNCVNLGRNTTDFVVDYNFTNGQRLNVYVYGVSQLSSGQHDFTINREGSNKGDVYIYCDSDSYFVTKYPEEKTGYYISSGASKPNVAIFPNGNEVLKKADENNKWVKQWDVVLRLGDTINNFSNSLSYYVQEFGSIRRINYDKQAVLDIDDESIVEINNVNHTLITKSVGKTKIKAYLDEDKTIYLGEVTIFVRNIATEVKLVNQKPEMGAGTEDDPIIVAKNSGRLSLAATTLYDGEFLPTRDDGYCADDIYWMFSERNPIKNYAWDDILTSCATSAGISLTSNKWEGNTNKREFKFTGNCQSYKVVAQTPINKTGNAANGSLIRSEFYVNVVDTFDYEISDKNIVYNFDDSDLSTITIYSANDTNVTIENSSVYGGFFYTEKDTVASTDDDAVWKLKGKAITSIEENEAVREILANNKSITLIIKADGAVYKETLSLTDEISWGEIEERDRELFDLSSITPTSVNIAGIEDASYTGSPITFDLRVYYGTNLLKKGKDYSVSYKNNVDASKMDASIDLLPTVIIKGKGKYAEGLANVSRTFRIGAISIEDGLVSNDCVLISPEKNTKVFKPVPVVMIDGKKLKNNTDFDLIYLDASGNVTTQGYSQIGTYTIKVIGKGNYQGELASSFSLADKDTSTMMSKATIGNMKTSASYTGSAIKIADLKKNTSEDITVKVNVKLTKETTQLTEGVDYIVDYNDNIDMGTATVIFKAKEGNNKGLVGEKRISVKISGEPISHTKIELKLSETDDKSAPSFEYTGKRIEPVVVVSTKGENPVKLKEGVDYTVECFDNLDVEYSKNVVVGRAVVYIKGMGIYSGKVKKTFRIVPVDFSKASKDALKVAIDNTSIVKNKKGSYEPKIKVMYKGKILTEGKDYKLNYKNNKKPGASTDGAKAPTIIIKGIKNYKKSIAVPFDINK